MVQIIEIRFKNVLSERETREPFLSFLIKFLTWIAVDRLDAVVGGALAEPGVTHGGAPPLALERPPPPLGLVIIHHVCIGITPLVMLLMMLMIIGHFAKLCIAHLHKLGEDAVVAGSIYTRIVFVGKLNKLLWFTRLLLVTEIGAKVNT